MKVYQAQWQYAWRNFGLTKLEFNVEVKNKNIETISKLSENIPENWDGIQCLKTEFDAYSSPDGILVMNDLPKFYFGNKYSVYWTSMRKKIVSNVIMLVRRTPGTVEHIYQRYTWWISRGGIYSKISRLIWDVDFNTSIIEKSDNLHIRFQLPFIKSS